MMKNLLLFRCPRVSLEKQKKRLLITCEQSVEKKRLFFKESCDSVSLYKELKRMANRILSTKKSEKKNYTDG